MDRDEAIRRLKAFRNAYGGYWYEIEAEGVPRELLDEERQDLTEQLPLIERLIEEVGESAAPLRQMPFNSSSAGRVRTTLDRAIGCYKTGIRSNAVPPGSSSSGAPTPDRPHAPGRPEALTLKERIENHPLTWIWKIALAAFLLGASGGYFIRELVDAAVKRQTQQRQPEQSPPARWGK